LAAAVEVAFLTGGFRVVVTVFLAVDVRTAPLDCAGMPITAKAVRKQKSR